ncbi:MAG: hypothetical protein ACE5KG_00235 [Nitrososphaerales archaeon]
MYPSLVSAGVLISLVGIVFIIAFLGAAGFALVFIIAGIIFIVVGMFTTGPPERSFAEPGMKFCEYCRASIKKEAEECPICSGIQPLDLSNRKH